MDFSSNNSDSSNTNNTIPTVSNDPAATAYPRDYASLSIEDKVIWQHLYDNIKIIAIPGCPTHPSLTLCSCADAFRSKTPDTLYRIKIDYFFGVWDQYLLLPGSGAYNYDGSQASHHAIQPKNNKTPKHFARDFAQEAMIESRFTPKGKLQDLVKAMVEFWVMRTTMWRARYGANAEDVKNNWMPEAYDMPITTKMSFQGLLDLHSFRPGGVLSLHETHVGPPGHECTVQLVRLDKVEDAFAFKVAKLQLCHVDCPTVLKQHGISEVHREAVQSLVQESFKNFRAPVVNQNSRKTGQLRTGYFNLPLENVYRGNSPDLRAYLGLQPDPKANTVEKEVVWVDLGEMNTMFGPVKMRK